ncbi:MAG: DUF1684 domain-containing protein [Hamadaea sp.]|uniref:DUF1684 domain-containing protein n=1 Tax=Hamadaea sp. TaxID=2024425 RepID=UPI0017A0126A|nr:DUF1684 domain-containing protein [Hamadaea sp.]NUT19129.1 DUF1684 domain-containing protein [Hamadaea sp.]
MAEDFRAEWERWRERRDRSLRNPQGWLSLTGLHWLGTDPATFDTVPGRWRVVDDTVYLVADLADGLTYLDTPVDGEVRVPDSGRVHHGDVQVEVIERGGWWALRVRDPQSPTLTGFTGVPAYAFDPAWVVEGRFERFPEAQEVKIGSVIDGLTHAESAIGVLRFTVGGQDLALTAFDGGDGSLDLLFRDATSGVTTYAASRSLQVPTPDADGRVWIDFNRAYNMPCAFTEYATCPLPPPENTLPVAVTAGEQKYH